MKKTISLTVLSFVLALNISCGGDEDNGTETPKITGALSVEEGKKQLEDNSISLIDKVDAFQNNAELNEIIELAEFLSGANTTKPAKFKTTLFNTLNNATALQTAKNSTVFNTKQALAIVAETPLTDDFNEEKGMYLWNAEIEDFERTGNSEDIIYTVNYNNKVAVFTVSDFAATVTGNQVDDNEVELPTLVKANLNISNKTVFSQDFSASFRGEKFIPATIKNTTILGGFRFTTSYTNANDTKITQSFEFKIDNSVINSFVYTANGNFSNLETDTEGNIEDFIDSSTFSFQFLDANLTITANDSNFDSEANLTIDQEIALLNSNIKGELSINNKSIAVSEFYKDQDTYTDYVYNPTTNSFDEVEVREDISNLRFLFEDGTSNDFDTYFEGSFTALENKFETVFEAYEILFEDIN